MCHIIGPRCAHDPPFTSFMVAVPAVSSCLLSFWGIRHGLVVTMPGSQAWVRRFECPLDPQAGWAWSLYKCAALLGTVLWSFCNWKTPWNYSWRVGNFFPVLGFYLVVIWPKLLKATQNPIPSFLPSVLSVILLCYLA